MDRNGEILLQRVEDVSLGFPLEDGAEDVEVPVGVELVGPVLLRAAWRRLGKEVAGVRGDVVDADLAPNKSWIVASFSLGNRPPTSSMPSFASVLDVSMWPRAISIPYSIERMLFRTDAR